ncbi:hypothetical protein BV25DRAFT_1920080 [Artomyces pyxidatus]|uniref:Uncharacterized protein n=1 Tax=Artomyces pyxidatus TaxID=48021 RepID=A0ACB8SLS4_9AGAM|nr:hypothetical protein BV25DRAFT_1920080 [Artomyces pyxidatus]
MNSTLADATDATSDLPISATTLVDAGASSPSNGSAEFASENLSSCNGQSSAASKLATPPILLVDVPTDASAWANETQDLLHTIGTSASGFAYLGDGAHSLDMAASASAKRAQEALDVLGMIGGAGAGASPSVYDRSHVGTASGRAIVAGVRSGPISPPRPVAPNTLRSVRSPLTPRCSVERIVRGYPALDTSLEMLLIGRSVWWSSPIWTLFVGNEEDNPDGM